MLTPWKESYDQPRQHIKKQRHYFVNKGPSSQGYGFSCGHIGMWELDCEESWAPKNWRFWTVVLEKTLGSPLAYKEIQPVHPKGNQSWVFIGRTDEAGTPVFWPPDVKSWLIWKDPDVGKDWRQEEKGTTEDEKVRWHHRLNGHEFGYTPGVGDGQEAWRAVVHGVAKSQTQLSDWNDSHFCSMAPAWKTISMFYCIFPICGQNNWEIEMPEVLLLSNKERKSNELNSIQLSLEAKMEIIR